MIGSTDEDVLLLEEQNENVYVNIRHTKDFHFVTVNTFSPTSSKVTGKQNWLVVSLDCCKLIILGWYNKFYRILGLSGKCS